LPATVTAPLRHHNFFGAGFRQRRRWLRFGEAIEQGRPLDAFGTPAEAHPHDPAARRAGLLDPEMKVTGAATDLPLRQGSCKPGSLLPPAH
jgi:hypothetical protein